MQINFLKLISLLKIDLGCHEVLEFTETRGGRGDRTLVAQGPSRGAVHRWTQARAGFHSPPNSHSPPPCPPTASASSTQRSPALALNPGPTPWGTVLEGHPPAPQRNPAQTRSTFFPSYFRSSSQSALWEQQAHFSSWLTKQ